MKKMLVLVAVLAFSSMAVAQPVDPDPDGMSIYFDEAGTQFCAPEPGVYQPNMVYLVLTNPSTSAPAVLSWEAQIYANNNAAFGVGGDGNPLWTLMNDGLNVGSGIDFVVGLGANPLAITGDAVVLASANMVYGGPGGYAEFFIGRATGSLTFPDGAGYAAQVGFPTPAQHIFGDWATPCAWINPGFFGVDCGQVVANEDLTWGAVKALY